MEEIKMTDEQIQDEIKFEDQCGVNDFLQHLLSPGIRDNGIPYRIINNKNEIRGWIIRDRKTGEDMHM